MKKLYFDEDSDARFYQFEAGTMTAGDLDAILANLAQTKIDTYIVGVNAQFANFRNPVVESYLDDFKMELGRTQSCFCGELGHWSYRRRANMAVLEGQGIDSNEYLLNGARKLGMAAWIDVRMNDMHNGHDEKSQIHTRFWKEHPELRIPGNIPCENGFDYSRKEVRDMFVAFIVEAYRRYSPDNVLLDWLRWPAFFERATEKENAHLITEMLLELREKIGRPFACRVPMTPESALALGLDVKSWVRKGLISHLFIGNFFCAPYFDVPVESWRSLVGDIPVIVSLDLSWEPGLKQQYREATISEARACAAAAFWRGADGLQFFNHMKMLRPPLASDLFKKALMRDHQTEYLEKGKILFNEFADPDLLMRQPRTVWPGWNDMDVRLGDLDQISRIPGYYEEWQKNHSRPEGTLPCNRPETWHLQTAKTPNHDIELFTDAAGEIEINGHIVTGPEPIKIPQAWMKDGETLIKTTSPVTYIRMEL